MKILAILVLVVILVLVAALAGCAQTSHQEPVTSDTAQVTTNEPSAARKVLYGLSVGIARFGDAWGQNMQDNPTPSLQPHRCYVSGDWVTCYPY